MRASGKLTALQIKDSIIDRINKGTYKAPTSPGISYMLAPVMRVYPANPDNNDIVTMSMPHYMFYTPYLTNKDFGLQPSDNYGPVLASPQTILGETMAPYSYVILKASEVEKAEILKDGKTLLKRLIDYKSYFKVKTDNMHH